MGSTLWRRDVRNFVSDTASSANELVPPERHLKMQVRRTRFIIAQYWMNASKDDLSAEIVGGCSPESGYSNDGSCVVKQEEDVKFMEQEIKRSYISCR